MARLKTLWELSDIVHVREIAGALEPKRICGQGSAKSGFAQSLTPRSSLKAENPTWPPKTCEFHWLLVVLGFRI